MQNDLLANFGSLFSADSLKGIGKPSGEILKRVVKVGAEDFTYQVYVPHVVEKTANLPVIVFLHGIRERGSGGLISDSGMLGKILKHYLKQVPSIIVFPQCALGKYWADQTMERMVIGAVEQTQNEFKTDSQRLYIIGVSMGGYGAWHLASKYPERIAALVSICGGSPILKGDRFNSIAEKVCKIPAWVFHGADDQIVPVTESREMVAAIEKNQGAVKYSEFPDVGHNVWWNVLSEKDLLPWLFKQKSL